MNIFDYVKKYDYTFEEKPFNEVDNLIFSTLIYIDYRDIINGVMTLENISKKYLSVTNINKKNKEIFAVKNAKKLLELIPDSKRFKDVLVYNYVYESDEKSQFGALTYGFNDTLYVAYEGTDDLISGWEEDFEMAYNFPVVAHKKAIKYLKRYTFTNKKLYVGGHSKGGNLALVAGMCSNFILRKKIINIYSNDGQGLRLSEIESNKYKRIKSKLIHFIPQNSIVGLLFRHDTDVVVKAKAPTIVSHIPSSWVVKEDSFERSELVKSSSIFDKGMIEWLNCYDYSKREKFITEVFDILRENEITSLLQIKSDFTYVFKLVKSSANVSDETKQMVNDLLKILSKVTKETRLEK
ncbi:MAG: DUF2974 domain-containing protein [Bacilli bacterium]|nr:DUF2974 domain-containing protein [Bacilli bacterium]